MIIQSPIFRKLLATAILLVAAAIVALDFDLSRLLSRRELERAERQLQTLADVFSRQLEDLPGDRLQAWAEDSGVRARARVTLIDPTGAVLADSE